MPPDLHRPSTLAGVRATAVALLALGVLGYLGWMLEFFLDTGLSPVHATPDELGAAGPYGAVFRTAELIAGAAFVLASPPLLRLAPVHRHARLTVATVFLFGALLLLHGAFPLDCPGLLSGRCAAPADPSAAHQIHLAVSILLSVVYLAGPGGLLLWWEGGWRVLAGVILAVEFVAWLVIILLNSFAPRPFAGIPSRIQLGAAAVLLSVGIGYLLTAGRYGWIKWEDAHD